MAWTIRIADEAKRGYDKLGNDLRPQVLAGIRNVSTARCPGLMGMASPWEISKEII